MFYSQFILAKKGPLGTIWIAAHLERKLRKNQVADTDIGVSVDSILFPEVPIALRLSSHLLLGVVRIYSKKVNYLFDDCSDALLKVKQAFRSTAVDLPPEQSKAPYHSITLPETFDLDDFELPENEVFQGNYVDHHISTREQITLQDNMDGVAFTTSQFGPDERFGDGDASQIGLDLDEELFMDKGDAAGASRILVGTYAGPQASTNESSPIKDDEHSEGVSEPPLASNTSSFIIQAPSTPGLTEEPNLPSGKEEIQVSDDHMDEDQNPCELVAKDVSMDEDQNSCELVAKDVSMDEDQNPCELVAKDVSGTASSPVEPFVVGGAELHSNGNVHFIDERDDEKAKTLGTESIEFISSGFTLPAASDEHMEATEGQDNVENQSEAAEVHSKLCCDVDEVGINGTAVPVAEDAIAVEVQGSDPYFGCNKTDLNDIVAENNKSSVVPRVLGTVEADTSGSEHQNSFQPCLNINENPSSFATPVLQACNSKAPYPYEEADNRCDASNLPAQDDGLSSIGIAINVSGISSNVRDLVEPTSKADQIAQGATFAADSNLGRQSDKLIAEEIPIDVEKNLQLPDFPPPEVLLSMPNLPTGLSDNFLVDSTPGKELVAKNDDVTDENVVSGRKRSFTESTLTVQSFNSVESCGGAQSKGTVESVPDDNDLLSSILVGRRSTTFKMKPTPPISDTVRAKRQRMAVRSVPHKRKVLVDDSTVLHGDTIRQQLTDTEDIRRVRKKAPCTKHEVWALQKQFLEDHIFNEPVFTGMCPALRSLDNEAFYLNEIRICRDEGNKGTSEDILIRSTLSEETEVAGAVLPSFADISTMATFNEAVEAVETVEPSIATGEGLQGRDGSPLEIPCEQESIFVKDGSTLLKEREIVDEVAKQISPHDASIEKVGVDVNDVRSPDDGKAIHSVPLGAESVSPIGHAPEMIFNSAEEAKGYSPSLDKRSDFEMSMCIDASGQMFNQRCVTECTMGNAFTAEDVSGSGIQDQGVVGISKNVDLDERSDGQDLFEKREGVDTNVVMGHFQDSSSLPVYDSSISGSIALEDRAYLTSDQVVDGCHPDELGIANKDERFGVGLEFDGNCLTANNVIEDVKLDLSYSVEANISSRNTTSNEGDGLQYWQADAKMVMDSTPIPSEFIDTGSYTEFGTDAIEHDTDFLNVDDDDVAEDYESDMPNPEEKHILDNSGWSSRTRAVANYLQALFEKESDQEKKVVSLGSLLVGKTRKEASRMFFETLVLKTKDYIHAEQETTFCDIKINPRGKLLKSDF